MAKSYWHTPLYVCATCFVSDKAYKNSTVMQYKGGIKVLFLVHMFVLAASAIEVNLCKPLFSCEVRALVHVMWVRLTLLKHNCVL